MFGNKCCFCKHISGFRSIFIPDFLLFPRQFLCVILLDLNIVAGALYVWWECLAADFHFALLHRSFHCIVLSRHKKKLKAV